MQYRVIGLMSGSSLDGLDIAFVELQEAAGKWTFEFLKTVCVPYDETWTEKLKNAVRLSAYEYEILHADYGHYLGKAVQSFIASNALEHQVHMVSSHGHTTFHDPARGMTGQVGDGAAIAAETGLPVVSDLRALDVALGGQGAPIVPIGEKLLLGDHDYFLNIGGIANLSINDDRAYRAFDVCPANKVLNMLASRAGKSFDENGALSASGTVNVALLEELNALAYYTMPFPKSLANDFGTDVLYPMIMGYHLSVPDALATMVEHIADQVYHALKVASAGDDKKRLLVTGGGALNGFLVERLRAKLEALKVEVVLPARQLIEFKEALVMALIGVLRWREAYNVMSSVTGAKRNSIGGALWLGGEA
jgi:anhydro-N-acetylmuramic acid kinase